MSTDRSTTTSHSNQSSAAVDPGPRGGAPSAGGPFSGLSAVQLAFFTSSLARFQAVETVPTDLGPGFNDIVCSNCHAFPAVGGSSPTTNPQVADATLMGATNAVPPFITSTGPVREACFVLNPDGTLGGDVHDLFTIAERSDAPGYVDPRPNFAAQLNVIFRIPTPTFGLGSVEETGRGSARQPSARLGALRGGKPAASSAPDPRSFPAFQHKSCDSPSTRFPDFLGTLMDAKGLISLATPSRFEPGASS
jgi:hypothetical protein